MTSRHEFRVVEGVEDVGEDDGKQVPGPRDGEKNGDLENNNEGMTRVKEDLLYSIDDVPPWYLSLLFGFQHYLTMFGSTLGIPLLLSIDLCMADNPVDVGKLIGTEFFVSGLATLVQTTFGSRLPIVQGASLAFLGPSQAILHSQGSCLDPLNSTDIEDIEVRAEYWRARMRLLQGAILVASIVEVIIGFTGLIGFLLRFIGPLTIAPTICLIGLSLFKTAANFAGQNWIVSGTTIALIILFSQYLGNVYLPLPFFASDKKWHLTRFPLFKALPVILAVFVAWILAAILTVTDVIPEGAPGRTDARAGILRDSPWFYIPHPFQWGIPVVTLAGVLGTIAGVLASTIESIGDYFACARVSGAPPPPDHAVNRGIGSEGIGCILAGLWGTGLGTTSYTQNIGVIGITKVGSRRVVQAGALFMIFLGSFGKFGAFFATIPIPIIGGMFCILFGLVAAVGLSNLQFVNLNSTRNLFVLGVSLMMGMTVPTFMKDNRGIINTRSQELNQILTVLFSLNMFVGGVVAAFLDNTIPGTREERGLAAGRGGAAADFSDSNQLKCYDFPFGMRRIRRLRFFRYLPFSPTYSGSSVKCCSKRKGDGINKGRRYEAVSDHPNGSNYHGEE